MGNIIGIDYSINSGAFCNLSQDGIFIGSLYRSEDSLEKLMKRKDRSIAELTIMKNAEFKLINKVQPKGEYHEVESQKIDSFIERSEMFFQMIKPHIKEDTKIFMEGISFGSTGSSLIDISMSTALVRERLISLIPSSSLYVFSPTSIKKFAGKGNFKKKDLYETILNVEDKRLCDLLEILSVNKLNWIKNSGDVISPWNDLIDSVWIALFGENFLK